MGSERQKCILHDIISEFTSHKATSIRTLTRRAQLVCDLTDSLTNESKYLDNVFSKNNYNPDFVKRNVYKNNEPNTTNAKPVTTATIPYIRGTSENIARILQPYNIRALTNRLRLYDNF